MCYYVIAGKKTKGGITTARRKKNTSSIKEAVKDALACSLPPDAHTIQEALEYLGLKNNNQNGIAIAMINKAISGDKAAAEWLRDASGEKNEDKNAQSSAVVIISGGDKIED